MEDKWEYETISVCIDESSGIEINKSCRIVGRGNLEYSSDPKVCGRTGYGFCLEVPYNLNFTTLQ